ncbi:MAG TPA: MaoC/PaaZ C-terminal domain-containing protein [Candidatus Paceibacterota bacterium]|nr:MaoC/PaaZ C-terminal domain-containing protein [Candidatus Paceibacterota bacterium]
MNRFKTIDQMFHWLQDNHKLVLVSKPRRLSRLRILLHSLASRDFNPAHCLSSFAPHSIFHSVVSHGIGIVARAEAEFLQLLQFDKAGEWIALGIKNLSYLKPLRCGDIYEYVFEISNVRKSQKFWKMDCQVTCRSIGSEQQVIATWHWIPALVKHELPEELLEELQPKHYGWNILRSFVIEPVKSLIIIGAALGAALIIFMGPMMCLINIIRPGTFPVDITYAGTP